MSTKQKKQTSPRPSHSILEGHLDDKVIVELDEQDPKLIEELSNELGLEYVQGMGDSHTFRVPDDDSVTARSLIGEIAKRLGVRSCRCLETEQVVESDCESEVLEALLAHFKLQNQIIQEAIGKTGTDTVSSVNRISGAGLFGISESLENRRSRGEK